MKGRPHLLIIIRTMVGRLSILHVQIPYLHGMRLNEALARRDVVAHEHGEGLVGLLRHTVPGIPVVPITLKGSLPDIAKG